MRGANGMCTRASRIAPLFTRGYGWKRRAKDESAKRDSIYANRDGERERTRCMYACMYAEIYTYTYRDIHRYIYESEREEEEEEDRGRGTESKQNLHRNSVPVGRVELRVFNAVHFTPLTEPLLPLFIALHPLEPSPLYSLSLSFHLFSRFNLLYVFLPFFLFLSFSLQQSFLTLM